jgi:hypothetical protein
MLKKYNWQEGKSTNELLEINNNFWVNLSEKAYPISHGNMRIPISLEPLIIKKEEYLALEKNMSSLISAAKKLATHYFDDVELRKTVVINPAELKLIVASEREPLFGIVRVDLFYSKKPKIVEINADFPDGFFMHDVTSLEISKLLIGKKVKLFNHAKLFDELLRSYNIDRTQHIFVGYDKERRFIDEFELTKIVLNSFGWINISVGAFEDLDYRNGEFFYTNKRVEVIRRGSELSKLRRIPGFIDKLLFAQANSSLKIINNFKMRLLGHKSLMAALCDKRFHKYLKDDEIEALSELLPETHKLDQFDINDLLNSKDEWVIKPSDLAEGEGVVVGIGTTETVWKEKISNALKNPEYWIVQKRVDIPQDKFNLINSKDGSVISGYKKYDFDPHVILMKDNQQLGTIMSRFSEADILNVMQGGGLTYTYVEA